MIYDTQEENNRDRTRDFIFQLHRATATAVYVLISLSISSRRSCRSSSLILSAREGISVLHSSAVSQQRILAE